MIFHYPDGKSIEFQYPAQYIDLDFYFNYMTAILYSNLKAGDAGKPSYFEGYLQIVEMSEDKTEAWVEPYKR